MRICLEEATTAWTKAHCASVERQFVYYALRNSTDHLIVRVLKSGPPKTRVKVRTCNGSWRTRNPAPPAKNLLKRIKAATTCTAVNAITISVGFVLAIGKITALAQVVTTSATSTKKKPSQIKTFRKRKTRELELRMSFVATNFTLSALTTTRSHKSLRMTCGPKSKIKSFRCITSKSIQLKSWSSCVRLSCASKSAAVC